MTIEQAWAIVLEHYHDALPADLQWRLEQKCEQIEADFCHCTLQMGLTPHDIPAPALTDAAAMAVAEVARVSVMWDRIGRYWEAFAANGNAISYAVESARFRDAIILAAAELAQRERAK